MYLQTRIKLEKLTTSSVGEGTGQLELNILLLGNQIGTNPLEDCW